MAAITVEQYKERLAALLKAAKEKTVDTIIVPAANELLATIKNRIMVEGKNSGGAPIGQYSTTPMYAGPSQFIKRGAFKPRGKNGPVKRGSAKGKPKTMYLAGGYKELRDIQGRPTNVMNYNYTGDTMLAYQLEKSGNAVLLGMVNERGSNIRQWLEQKRGKAFYATKQEIAAYNKNVSAEMALVTKKILNA